MKTKEVVGYIQACKYPFEPIKNFGAEELAETLEEQVKNGDTFALKVLCQAIFEDFETVEKIKQFMGE
ncbi:MAG: hypothetical protein J6V66_02845 [Clostridia bacterium]|nr:hypothetical protein [Clostridia bacterium]